MDNSYRTEQVKTQDARNAIDALLAHHEWRSNILESSAAPPSGRRNRRLAWMPWRSLKRNR